MRCNEKIRGKVISWGTVEHICPSHAASHGVNLKVATPPNDTLIAFQGALPVPLLLLFVAVVWQLHNKTRT
jgi:hypothetical protein